MLRRRLHGAARHGGSHGLCSDHPLGGGAGAWGVGGLPVGGAVRGDDPGGAVRPRGRGGQQRVHGHVPLRRVPPRRLVRLARLRPGQGLPLQVLGAASRAEQRQAGELSLVV